MRGFAGKALLYIVGKLALPIQCICDISDGYHSLTSPKIVPELAAVFWNYKKSLFGQIFISLLFFITQGPGWELGPPAARFSVDAGRRERLQQASHPALVLLDAWTASEQMILWASLSHLVSDFNDFFSVAVKFKWWLFLYFFEKYSATCILSFPSAINCYGQIE